MQQPGSPQLLTTVFSVPDIVKAQLIFIKVMDI